MYSEELRQEMEKKDIEIGDRIRIDGYEGRLMPKPESGNPEIPVLKLDSGYNIGLKGNLELIEKREEQELEKPAIEHEDGKPDILVLHTGGTIASRVSYEEGGVKPAFDPEDLVEMYPEVADEVNIYSEIVAQMLSEDMEPGHWQQIAEKINEVKDDYDGIIVGHGTDTMAYTGAALRLMLKGIDTGVLLVGAQRSSDRPSTDATMNLYCAAKFLSETEFKGVGTCMHASSSDGECLIMNAAKVRKMHTSRRDAFQPVNSDPLGKVNYQTGDIEDSYENTSEEYKFRPGLDTSVAYVKTRPGMKTEELKVIKDYNPGGVLIEGTGLGHMPVNSFDELTEHHGEILENLEDLAGESLAVMSSQCINGRTNTSVYDAGLKIQEAGVIEAGDMHPELAYVKLMWSLGQADSKEEAEQLFQKNIAGEIEERSNYNGPL